jgi:hypothetical protein
LSRSVHGSIDEPTAGAEIGLGPVRVSGWAFDEDGLLEAAMLVAGGGPGVPVRLGVWRRDVGKAHPSISHAASSGFEGWVDLRGSAAETARIALLVRRPGGPWQEAAAVEVHVPSSAPGHEPGRRRAAFTIVKDEQVMLPVWLGYYGRYFDPGDLYVLDHGSSDGSTAGLDGRCRVVPVHRDAAIDHAWLRSTVEAFQAFLLRSYETVLFADVDELVVADPQAHAGLDAYIEAFTKPAVRCVGFNVVQQPDEPPLRFDTPLLAQRRYWHASLKYSKRLLARIPLHWSVGFHHELNAPDDPPDPELVLVHLHRADFDVCLARHRAAAARTWNEADLRAGWGWQYRIAEPAELEAWFRDGADLESPRELIPEHVRSVL